MPTMIGGKTVLEFARERRRLIMEGLPVPPPDYSILKAEYYIDGKDDYDERGKPVFPGSRYHYMSQDELEEYGAMVSASDGFDVPDFAAWSADLGVIKPCRLRRRNESRIRPYAEIAIKHYNDKNREGKRLELVKVIKWNEQLTGSFVYYITMEARDLDSKEEGVYQAEVITTIPENEATVDIFRRKTDVKRKLPDDFDDPPAHPLRMAATEHDLTKGIQPCCGLHVH